MKSYRKVLLFVIAINYLIASILGLKINNKKEASKISNKSESENSKSNIKRSLNGNTEGHDNEFKSANNLSPEPSLEKSFNNMKNNEKKLIDCLFEKNEKTNCDCEGKVEVTARVKYPETSTIIIGGITITIPVPKPYPFKTIELYGFGASAYTFDYLDSVFQFDVVYEFIEVYWQIFNFKYEPESDPYWEKYLTGEKTEFTGIPNQEKKLKINFSIKLNEDEKKFTIPDRKIYDISIALPQLEYYFNEWGWQFNGKSDLESAKHFFNTYDFNGDGRLSPRELILGIILENLDNETCKFCFQDLRLKFGVMFKYMKCYAENHLLVIQMVKKMKYLKRQSKKEYNLYNCPSDAFIRQSVSDFFTKTQESDLSEGEALSDERKGRVDIYRFRRGLLLGFWNRQVSDSGIYASQEIIAKYETEYNVKIEKRDAFIIDVDAKTEKVKRWSGKVSINECPPPIVAEPVQDCY